MRITAMVFLVLMAGTMGARAEEARQLIQVGNEVCKREADYNRYWRALTDGTAAHQPGYHSPSTCFMVMYPARAFVLARPTANKTKVRILDGQHAGTVGWTDADLPRTVAARRAPKAGYITGDHITCSKREQMISVIKGARSGAPKMAEPPLGCFMTEPGLPAEVIGSQISDPLDPVIFLEIVIYDRAGKSEGTFWTIPENVTKLGPS